MGLYWLASYPKSGNTWMRALMTAYLAPERPLALNAFAVRADLVRRDEMDELLGVPTADLRPDELERLHPDACLCLADDVGDEPYVVKVHAGLYPTPDGRLFYPPEATAGAVYIVRNPLDVAASFAPFMGWTVDHTVAVLGQPDFVLNEGDGRRVLGVLPERLGRWSDHVESWLDAPGYRVCLVRYEDLLVDAASEFENVLRFLGYDPEVAHVEAAVERARFDRLQKQEAQDGFSERSPVAPSFFRKGRAGDWRETLAPEQAALIVAQHGPVMRRLGYDALVEEVEAGAS